jgi:hypothetical protein
MRKRPISLVGAALAVTAAITASAALAGPTVSGPDGNTQSVESVIAPKKLPKKTLSPASLKVVTRTGSTTDPTGKPSPATRAVIDFDKGARLFNKGLPTCNPAKIQSVSTEVAEENCGTAKIGSGTAHALLKTGTSLYDITQTVTAFNGTPQGGKPTVLLHVYGTTPVQTTLVLVGTVSNYDKEGYGPRLDITIPLIVNGQGALTEFEVTIDKKYSYKGAKQSFISAACDNGNFKTRAAFTYLDGTELTATHSQKCTPKPEPKKK